MLERWILRGVGKSTNVIIKQVVSLVDSEIVACQCVFFVYSG